MIPANCSSSLTGIFVFSMIPSQFSLLMNTESALNLWHSLSVEKYPNNRMLGCREIVNGKVHVAV